MHSTGRLFGVTTSVSDAVAAAALLPSRGSQCRSCGERYETSKLRAWLLTAAEERLATATEIAQSIPALYGRQISDNTVRWWINRGRLFPRVWMHGRAALRPASGQG
jgi:hypothetical protein